MANCDCGNHNGNFLNGLIIGAVLGAGIYYFLSQTDEGGRVIDKVLEEIKEKSDDFGQKIEEAQEKLNVPADQPRRPLHPLRFFSRSGKVLS